MKLSWSDRRQDRPGLVRVLVQAVVQADRGVDERQMGEGLREVAQLLARAADLLGVQAQVVAVGVHLLEGEDRVVHSPGPGKRVHVQERAEREGALVAAQSVR